MSYEQLPPELITEITDNLSISDVRLLNKTTLKANDVRFCENIKITKQEMIHYINNTDDKIVVFLPSKVYIFEYGTLKNILFNTTQSVQLYVGYNEKIADMKMDDYIIKLDLYSLYIIYKSKNCDKIVKNYAKNKVIKILNEHLKNNELNKYVYLMANAIALNLRKPIITEKIQLNNLIKDINHQLYTDILNFLNQLD